MARTVISSQTPKGPFPGTVGSGALDLTLTAADTTNNNAFALTGHELLLVQNTDTVAQTFTLTSTADAQGRIGDVTAYSVAAGKISAFNFRGGQTGWKESDGNAYISGAAATLKFAVLYLA